MKKSLSAKKYYIIAKNLLIYKWKSLEMSLNSQKKNSRKNSMRVAHKNVQNLSIMLNRLTMK